MLVWQFRQPRATVFAAELEPVSEPAVLEPERTIVQDLTATDVDYLRVSDEDIERAINELRAVLRKSSSS